MYSCRYPCPSILRKVKSPSVSGPLYRYRPAVEPLPAGETPLKIDGPVYTVPSWFRDMLPPLGPPPLRKTVPAGAPLKIESITPPVGALSAVNVTYGSVTIEIVPLVVGSFIE